MTDERITHPTPRRLLDHHDGVPTGRRGAEVAAHLEAGCGTCSARVAALADLTATITDGPLEPPPAAVVRRARALFGRSRLLGAVERARDVLAQIVFDERLRPAVALRSLPGMVRRILWTVEGYEIYVSTAARADGLELRGEVLPREDDDRAVVSGHVSLEAPGGAARRRALDGEGGFVFTGLREGTYVLRGSVGGLEFRTPPVVLD